MESNIIGEAVAGHSFKVRQQLEDKIQGINTNTFDVAELLHETEKNKYYINWGFNTFKEYAESVNLKLRKAQYLVRIVEVMKIAGIPRSTYEKAGTSKLREITSINPNGKTKNPHNDDIEHLEIIKLLVAEADNTELSEIKEAVKVTKGLTGENERVWRNFNVSRLVAESVLDPAIEKAKALIGSIGRDSDGDAIDPTDGEALETIAIEFLNDPNTESAEPIEIGEKY